MTGEAKLIEERKRDACWDPVERWRVIQDTIAWVDSQQKVPRNSRRSCLAKQRMFLGDRGKQRDSDKSAEY